MIKLNADETAELARAWIERHRVIEKFGLESKEAGLTFPIYMALENLVSQSPECAWDVIVKIFNETDDEYVLSNLAAGPLETLLGRHGRDFIHKVEALASADSKFKDFLDGVWKGMMNDEVWNRVRKASGQIN